MKCENCRNNEANVRYTQIINGIKKEMHLCEECSRELGIGTGLGFDMNIDIPSFFGGFFDEYNSLNLLPTFGNVKYEQCDSCGMTYDEFARTGKFGCMSCYDTFSDRLDPILKSIQGNNRHIGRRAKRSESDIFENDKEKNNSKEETRKNDKVSELKNKLKLAIDDERYEDAAKLRDEINKLEKKEK